MELSQTRIQTKEKVQLFTPAAIFLILGLLVGIFYSVLIPYGAGFDEEMHQMRIVDITFRHMLPNRGVNDATPTFIEFLDLSYQRRYFNDPANDMFSPEKFLVNLDLEKIIYLKTRSIYSPVMFLPEALVAYVGLRLFNLPVIPVTIVERLAGLLVYLLGAFLQSG